MENWTIIDPQTAWLCYEDQLIYCESRCHFVKDIPVKKVLDLIDHHTYIRNIFYDSKNCALSAKVDVYCEDGEQLSNKTKKLISMDGDCPNGIPITIRSSIQYIRSYSDHFSFYPAQRYEKTSDWIFN